MSDSETENEEIGTEENAQPEPKPKHEPEYNKTTDPAHCREVYRRDKEDFRKDLKARFRHLLSEEWLYLISIWNYIALFSVLLSYWVVTYIIVFDIRFYTWTSPAPYLLHLSDIIYILDYIWKVYSGGMHPFRYHYQPTHFGEDVIPHCCTYFWSLVHIFSLVPFEYFALIKGGQWTFAILKLNRLFRLQYVYHWFLRRKERIAVTPKGKVWKGWIIPWFCVVFIVYHALACSWYRVSCEPFSFGTQLPECQYEWLYRYLNMSVEGSSHPFLKRMKLVESGPIGYYIACVFWSLMTIRHSSNFYGAPLTIGEMQLSLVFVGFTFFVQFCLLITLINSRLNWDVGRLIYFADVQGVKNCMNQLNFSNSVKNDAIKCFRGFWNLQRIFTGSNVRSILPPALNQYISLERFAPLIYSSELLHYLSQPALESLAAFIEVKTYLAGDFIIRPGTIGYNMIYLSSGRAQIVHPETHERILSFAAGSLFGEADLVCPSYRYYGLQAVVDCEVMTLSFENANHILRAVPGARRNWHIVILRRLDFVAPRLTPEEERSSAAGLHKKGWPKDELQTQFDALPLDVYFENIEEETEASDKAIETEETIFRTRNSGPLAYYRYLRMIHFNPEFLNRYNAEVARKMNPSFRNRASNASYKLLKTVWFPSYKFGYGFMISTESAVAVFWNLLMLIYMIGFSVWLMFATLKAKPAGDAIFFISVTEIVYTVDLILNFVVFRDPNEITTELDLFDVTDHIHLELRNPKSWFDIAAIFPLWYLSETHPPELEWHLIKLAKLFGILYKVWKLENDINTSLLLSRVIKHTVNIMTFVMIVAFIDTFSHCRGQYKNCQLGLTTNGTDVDDALDDPESSKFGLFMFWCISVVFGIGFRGISGFSNSWAYIPTYLIGYTLLVHAWSELISTSIEKTDLEIKFKKSRLFVNKILEESYADLKLIKLVDTYFLYQWRGWKGIGDIVEHDKLSKFHFIRHNVYTEMLIQSSADTIYSIWLFRHMDPNIIRDLCSNVKLLTIRASRKIINYGDFVRYTYIIRRGVVEVKIISGLGSNVAYKYGPGQTFGFGEMLLQIPSLIQVVCCSDVELLMIEANTFEGVIGQSKYWKEPWRNASTTPSIRDVYMKTLAPKGWLSPSQHLYTDINLEKKQPLIPALNLFLGPSRQERLLKKGYQKWKRPWQNSSWWIRMLRFITCKCTINPTKGAARFWELFYIGNIYALLFIVPLVEAYPCLKQSLAWLLYFWDVLSVVNMIIRSYMAYFSPRYEYHPAQTIRNYLTSAFITDLLAGPLGYYPTAYIIKNHAPKWFQKTILAYLLKMNRILSSYYIYRFHKQGERALKDPSHFRKVLRVLPILMFHAHVMSCMLTVAACPQLDCPYKTPRCELNTWISSSKVLLDAKHQEAESRGFVTGFTHAWTKFNDKRIYMAAFYYTTTTAAGCAFGDFTAVNSQERIFMATTLFFYIIVTGIIMGRVVAIKPAIDFGLRTFQRNVNHLMDFLVQENVDYHLKTAVLGHYEHQWHKVRDGLPREHLRTLFPNLRADVGMHLYHYAFEALPELRSSSPGFLRALCEIIYPIYIPMGQTLFREWDLAEVFYIIKSGSVKCSKQAYMGSRIKDSGLLGSFTCFFEYSCQTVDQTQLLVFSKKNFELLEDVFPEDFEKLQKAWRKDLTKPYNRDGNGKPFRKEESKNLPVTRTLSDMTPLSKKERTLMDLSSSHNMKLYGYKKRVDPTFEEPLATGFSPLAELDNDFDEPNFDPVDRYLGFVIHHNGTCDKMLELLYFVGALGSCIMTAYQLGFKNFTWYCFVVSYAFDGVYIAKMIVRFFVSSVDDDGTIVADRGDMAAKYFGSFQGFTYDLMTIFPFEVIVPSQIAWFDPLHLLALFRSNRLLRVKHVWDYFLPENYNAGFNVHLNKLKILRIIFLTIIYLHWMACILMFGTFSNCDHIDWAKQNFTDCLYQLREKTWLGTKHATEDILVSPYSYTLYFVFTTFCGTSFQDVRAATVFEMVVVSFLAMSSKVWLSLTLADLINCIHVFLEPRTVFSLAARQSLAEYHMDGVSKPTMKKAMNHLEALWVQGCGTLQPQLVTELPGGLKMDLMYYIHEKYFNKSYLFYNLPENFLRALSIRFQRLLVLGGEYIVKSGHVGDRMYFVNYGNVVFRKIVPDISSDTNQGLRNTQGAVTSPRHFGDANALLGIRAYHCTYMADTDCELAYLDFESLHDLFDPCFLDVKKIIMKRFEKALDARQESPSESDESSSDEFDDGDPNPSNVE